MAERINLIDRKQALALLGISRTSLDKYTQLYGLWCNKFYGKQCRYDGDELKAFRSGTLDEYQARFKGNGNSAESPALGTDVDHELENAKRDLELAKIRRQTRDEEDTIKKIDDYKAAALSEIEAAQKKLDLDKKSLDLYEKEVRSDMERLKAAGEAELKEQRDYLAEEISNAQKCAALADGLQKREDSLYTRSEELGQLQDDLIAREEHLNAAEADLKALVKKVREDEGLVLSDQEDIRKLRVRLKQIKDVYDDPKRRKKKQVLQNALQGGFEVITRYLESIGYSWHDPEGSGMVYRTREEAAGISTELTSFTNTSNIQEDNR